MLRQCHVCSLAEQQDISGKSVSQAWQRGDLVYRATLLCRQRLGQSHFASMMRPEGCLRHVQAEEGLCAGRVLYHSHVHKSAEEDAAQQEEIVERTRLKAERRREQVALTHLEEALAAFCP